MTRAAVLRSAVALVVIALLVPSASVAKKKRKKIVWHHYAVPFTCGVNAADTARVVPGTYAVSMDLHNASAGDATLIQYLALTFPPGGIAAGVASGPDSGPRPAPRNEEPPEPRAIPGAYVVAGTGFEPATCGL